MSGLPWSEYLRRHVFEPAGMTTAGVDLAEEPDGLAEVYTLRALEQGRWSPDGRRRVDMGPGMTARVRPAGSGYASAPDMWKFLEAVRNAKILGPEYSRLVTSPQIEVPVPPGLPFKRFYGFTFDVFETETGVRRVGHSGGAAGISTVVQFYPDHDLSVVILSNFDRAALWVNTHIQELLGVL